MRDGVGREMIVIVQNNMKTFRWIIGILVTVVVLVGGAWAGRVQTRVDANTCVAISNQVVIVTMQKQLDRIEQKLDRLVGYNLP